VPRLSVWFVRASLLYLAGGFMLGALLLAQKGVPFYAGVWTLFPVHIEFLLVGWLMQFAMGVGFWILPRFGRGAPRGNESMIWGAFVLLNAGILLTASQIWVAWLAPVGRAFELASVLTYIIGSWRRVKPMVLGPEGMEVH
jgi:hypothetical protein